MVMDRNKQKPVQDVSVYSTPNAFNLDGIFQAN
jgi:hypothetical protein